METVRNLGWGKHPWGFLARSRPFALTLVVTDLIWRCGVAHADRRDDQLFDMLSWLLIVPLGIVQFGAAFWVERQIEKATVGATIFATLASLAAGIVVAVSDDKSLIRPVMLTLFLGPGVPNFIALARKRLWAPALFMFLFLPGLLAILPR